MSNTTMFLLTVVVIVLLGGFLLMRNQPAQDVMTTPETETESETADTGAMMEESDTANVVLSEVADSDTKQSGTATLVEKDGMIEVTVTVSPAVANPQPAHIHIGECPGVGDVAYPLENLINGTSTTQIDITMEELMAQKPLAINIHKSAEEASVYTACGAL